MFFINYFKLSIETENSCLHNLGTQRKNTVINFIQLHYYKKCAFMFKQYKNGSIKQENKLWRISFQ